MIDQKGRTQLKKNLVYFLGQFYFILNLYACGYQLQNIESQRDIILDWEITAQNMDLDQGEKQRIAGILATVYDGLSTEIQLEYERIGWQGQELRFRIELVENQQASLQSYDRFGRLNLIQQEIKIRLKIERAEVLWESQIQARHWQNRHQSYYAIQDQAQISRDEWYLCLKNALYEYLSYLKSISKK
jgi:hypothetical protein